jgi:hypothetical protein
MLLKIKGRCGKSGAEAGMCLKTKEIRSKSGNVVEKKGGRAGFRIQDSGFRRDRTKAHMREGGAIFGLRFLPPNSVQVVAHILAVSPFSTLDLRLSTLDPRLYLALTTPGNPRKILALNQSSNYEQRRIIYAC